MKQVGRKDPREYQRHTIEDVRADFEAHDRRKLILACGKWKTYNSPRNVEETVPGGGSVLFLVPFIALLQQT